MKPTICQSFAAAQTGFTFNYARFAGYRDHGRLLELT